MNRYLPSLLAGSLLAAASAVILLSDISTSLATSQAAGVLTAEAQILATVLGLAITVVLIFTQLSSLFGRRNVGVLHGPGIAYLAAAYVGVLLAALLIATSTHITPLKLKVALLAGSACLCSLIYYLADIRDRLVAERIVERLSTSISKTLGRQGLTDAAQRRIAVLDSIRSAAVTDRDYGIVRVATRNLFGIAAETARLGDLKFAGEVITAASAFVVASRDVVVSKIVMEEFVRARVIRAVRDLSDSNAPQFMSEVIEAAMSIALAYIDISTAEIEQVDSVSRIALNVVRDCADSALGLGHTAGLSQAKAAIAAVREAALLHSSRVIAGRASHYLALYHGDARPRVLRVREDARTSANLLLNGSFEMGHWVQGRNLGWFPCLFPGEVYERAYPAEERERSGQWSLVFSTHKAGASVAQDVPFDRPDDIRAGESFLLRVRLAKRGSHTCRDDRVYGRLALWGLGGLEERGVTSFSLTTADVLVTATCDIESPGHHALRAEIYLDTVGAEITVDDAELLRLPFTNSTFELGTTAGWKTDAGCTVKQDFALPAEIGGEHDLEICSGGRGAASQRLRSLQVIDGEAVWLAVWARGGGSKPTAAYVEVLEGNSVSPSRARRVMALAEAWDLCGTIIDWSYASSTRLQLVATEGPVLFKGPIVIPLGVRNPTFREGPFEHWEYGGIWTWQNIGVPNPVSGEGEVLVVPRNESFDAFQVSVVQPSVGTSLLFSALVKGYGGTSLGETSLVRVTVAARSKDGTTVAARATAVDVMDGSEWLEVSVPLDVSDPRTSVIEGRVHCDARDGEVGIGAAYFGRLGSFRVTERSLDREMRR